MAEESVKDGPGGLMTWSLEEQSKKPVGPDVYKEEILGDLSWPRDVGPQSSIPVVPF